MWSRGWCLGDGVPILGGDGVPILGRDGVPILGGDGGGIVCTCLTNTNKRKTNQSTSVILPLSDTRAYPPYWG